MVVSVAELVLPAVDMLAVDDCVAACVEEIWP